MKQKMKLNWFERFSILGLGFTKEKDILFFNPLTLLIICIGLLSLILKKMEATEL